MSESKYYEFPSGLVVDLSDVRRVSPICFWTTDNRRNLEKCQFFVAGTGWNETLAFLDHKAAQRCRNDLLLKLGMEFRDLPLPPGYPCLGT